MTDYRVLSSTGTVHWQGQGLPRAKQELALARHVDAGAVIQFYDPGSADDPGDWFTYRKELRENMARRRPKPTLVDIECETPYLWKEFKRIAAQKPEMFGYLTEQGWQLPDTLDRMPSRFHDLLRASGCKATPLISSNPCNCLVENPVGAIGWIIGGAIVAGGAYLLLREPEKKPTTTVTISPTPIAPAPPLPKCPTMAQAQVFAKAKGYTLVTTGTCSGTCRKYVQASCSFFRWDGLQWVKDDATNAEYLAWAALPQAQMQFGGHHGVKGPPSTWLPSRAR